MPRLNFYFLLIAVLLYFLCSDFSLRDRVLIHSLHTIERESLVEPSAKQLFEGAMAGMVEELYPLHDDYSSYIPYTEQKDFEDGLDNRFEGIGVLPEIGADGYPEVVYPLLHSPAYRAGLRSGDRILKIDDRPAKDLSLREVANLFRGKAGTRLRLTVLPFGKGEQTEISVNRDSIEWDSVEGDFIDNEGNRVFYLQTHSDIGYIRITSFSDRTPQELLSALKTLQKENIVGLILDLRHNPGGYVATSVQIANYFIQPTPEQDVIVSTRHRNGQVKSIHYAHHLDFHFDKPMLVLIDGETASAAEILSACLQDYGRATIAGSRSFGKGIVQELFALPLNSGTLSLSDASYWRPSQKNINRFHDSTEGDEWGVTPDPHGLISVPKKQSSIQMLIRNCRSNAVNAQKDRFLDDFVKNISQKIKQGKLEDIVSEENNSEDQISEESEKKDKETDSKQADSVFFLQGSSPYFDPQLDKAIELMQLKIFGSEKKE